MKTHPISEKYNEEILLVASHTGADPQAENPHRIKRFNTLKPVVPHDSIFDDLNPQN